ncbi:ABC transporter substrate-binding protein [Cognatishimia sp. SS12]|uniref:ABC transporter substrate-binding protein n=1 Tax=Cognatishimia sp. SS12 TaxID=2979465 RepID=UPI0023309F79|nr:ABC transporter substrate-binding protein [Cognatishimia sp. SS12]MDC0739333.1 ABC transporter substrate-binding protein [Cognatishimia sp. SS12]
MQSKVILAGAFVAGSLAFSSQAMAADLQCGVSNGQAASGEPIVLGAIVGRTGPDDFGTSARAAEAYFDCVNENGGIHGRPVKYIVGDDQWNPEIAAQLAAKIVKDEGALAMVGNSSFMECAANARLYSENNIMAVSGVGVPRECFAASNIAATNAGPRISTTAAAEFAGEVLGAKSVVCIGPNIPNVGAWACDGVTQWSEANGLKANTILIDPASLDATSLVLQAISTGADSIVLSLPKGIMLPVLTAAEEQGFDQSHNWLSAASGYDLSVPVTLGSNWDGRFYVNMEFNPLQSDAPDNQNWLAVMDSYADDSTPRDTFAQAGYLAARVVTDTLLALDPSAMNRDAVTAALSEVNSFESDIFCATWYIGKDQPRQNANHTTRMAVVQGDVWETVGDCRPSADPELADIHAYEASAGIN